MPNCSRCGRDVGMPGIIVKPGGAADPCMSDEHVVPRPLRFVSYFPSQQTYIGAPVEKTFPEHGFGTVQLSFSGQWEAIGIGGVDAEGDTWLYSWATERYGLRAKRHPPVWVRLRDFLERP